MDISFEDVSFYYPARPDNTILKVCSNSSFLSETSWSKLLIKHSIKMLNVLEINLFLANAPILYLWFSGVSGGIKWEHWPEMG